MPPYLRIALEILTSIVIGVLSSFFVQDPYADLAIGVLAFLVIEVSRMGLAVDELSHSVGLLAEVAQGLLKPSRNGLDAYFSSLLLGQLNRSAQNSGPHRIAVPASQGHAFWLRLFPYTESSYQATSFTPYEEGWERGFSDKGMLLHKAKLEAGVQISRVFIYSDAAELARLRPVIQAQQELGISVRAISLERVKKIRLLAHNFQRFGSYDFAILDGTHVFKVNLDRRRQWTGIELLNDAETLALAKQIYEDLWEEAAPA